MIATLKIDAAKLDKARSNAGLSRDADLARAINTDRGNLSRILSGRQAPGPKFIASICRALGVSTEDVFELVEAEPAEPAAA